MPFLTLKNITKDFGTHSVLRDVSLSIKEGEFISLLGASGCGKSTLLRIIAGLESPSSGKIFLKKQDITSLKPSKRSCGLVFQSYALFPHMSAGENLAFPLRQKGYSRKKIEQVIAQNFELVGLRGFESKMPSELSGGQQQRVSLARAIALRPKILLLDEPLSALDAKVRAKLRHDIKLLHRELGITSIMVTHDQEEAIMMSDRIALLSEGEIVQIDTPYRIYHHPSHLVSAKFIGEVNTFAYKNELHLLRPEHIHLKREKSATQDSKKGVVSDIAFMGGFFKITLQAESEVVCMISTKEFSQLEPRIGESLQYSFSPKHIMRYKAKSGCAIES